MSAIQVSLKNWVTLKLSTIFLMLTHYPLNSLCIMHHVNHTPVYEYTYTRAYTHEHIYTHILVYTHICMDVHITTLLKMYRFTQDNIFKFMYKQKNMPRSKTSHYSNQSVKHYQANDFDVINQNVWMALKGCKRNTGMFTWVYNKHLKLNMP